MNGCRVISRSLTKVFGGTTTPVIAPLQLPVEETGKGRRAGFVHSNVPLCQISQELPCRRNIARNYLRAVTLLNQLILELEEERRICPLSLWAFQLLC